MARRQFDLVIDEVRREARDVISLVLREPGGGRLPRWEPGAHIDVTLPSGLSRQYSLCGDVNRAEEYVVAVLREEHGRGGSRELHDIAATGQKLTVGEPRNNFPFDQAEKYLFLAGGIGITPILPMIAAACARGASWKLLYGGRTLSSMAFREHLAAYPAERLELCPEDTHGRPDFAAALRGAGPDTLVYACGPGGMLDAVAEQFATHATGASLRVERFGADGPADTSGAAFEVVLGRTGTTVLVPEEHSILAAVRDAVPDVAYSCEEGYCGECETPVLEGTPDHRDSYLTEDEREAGETMMICVSRCLGGRLVLDL
ncbi:oxidoreductase [Amycolatopsis sp. K13G38]|uniref:Oxidoreductase n=1 Tax=Amycolatopsis acididurans TaxID=2724524 RepID=A0ABX1J3A7_9PSEU|nr:PDR/VanB family oxidoreductase [Amycolatopsis acididurans]NKQ54257.1 oxidoreductase [Amycolatopsis acididurans]